MKKLFRTMTAAILCAVIAITSIGTDTAYAAGKMPFKVTFNKKSVTISKDITERITKVNLKTLKNKWGKPKKKTNDGNTTYTWKKGKTSICYSVGEFSNIDISIEDKNGEISGLKVGMAKDAALKRMEKLGIKDDDVTEVPRDDGTVFEVIRFSPSRGIGWIYFTNGKVSGIYGQPFID